MKRQTAYWLIFTVWTVPIIISIPSALMASETPYLQADGLRLKTFCAQIWPVDQQLLYRSYFLLVFALEFVGPVSVMSVCYARICRELWFKGVPGFRTPQVRRRLWQRRRTVLVLVLVLAAYVLCWAPYYAFALLRDFYPTLISRDRNSLVAFYIIECIAMSNGIVNTLCFTSVRRHGNAHNNPNRRPRPAAAPATLRLRLLGRTATRTRTSGDAKTSSLRVTEELEARRSNI